MRTELRVHSGAQPHCPDVSASLGPAEYERDGEGSRAEPVATVFSTAAAASVSPSSGVLEGGFGRVWLVRWCAHREEIILYFHISQVTGRLGEGPKALASIQGAALVL